jgi:hypothetical protein
MGNFARETTQCTMSTRCIRGHFEPRGDKISALPGTGIKRSARGHSPSHERFPRRSPRQNPTMIYQQPAPFLLAARPSQTQRTPSYGLSLTIVLQRASAYSPLLQASVFRVRALLRQDACSKFAQGHWTSPRATRLSSRHSAPDTFPPPLCRHLRT